METPFGSLVFSAAVVHQISSFAEFGRGLHVPFQPHSPCRIALSADDQSGEPCREFACAAAIGSAEQVGVSEAVIRLRVFEKGKGFVGSEGHRVSESR